MAALPLPNGAVFLGAQPLAARSPFQPVVMQIGFLKGLLKKDAKAEETAIFVDQPEIFANREVEIKKPKAAPKIKKVTAPAAAPRIVEPGQIRRAVASYTPAPILGDTPRRRPGPSLNVFKDMARSYSAPK
mmetsp:Transcript_27597/g.47651  ORF Transcript_27597/g.47651 Transcript_27597/m.47651 type:complete len:131 (+) Transcript_27597:112-504(+)|eukprot:CAMPEP_0196655718 /NCGR_PEP_ID=MMETSP1086-20130531/6388_1 /TAXON_ID=77921 /ORGANISM="Cyanoptyche  gloeocystis , Strain SAG4.97" /LENGTH=130 /DNA_ID=CAMNT_0041988179 /DNA_START=112 /DNA_END=504 /DNA_ORIENTATION=-